MIKRKEAIAPYVICLFSFPLFFIINHILVNIVNLALRGEIFINLWNRQIVPCDSGQRVWYIGLFLILKGIVFYGLGVEN